ncbi:vitelline envelope sperm lysin receptor-like [Gigantopelta aegis]|uniref:vitelline envelope sperm lysin receptor-like n=1 Tax=Gigantopelta aegis TaxID=1735272 RepID=UPI001B889E44|nr:vitelline envelope sperm lysin receptor-like [Gigantopelta aegis]
MLHLVFNLSLLSMVFIEPAVTAPYIIRVSQACANDTYGVTTIHVVVDVVAQVMAHCKNNLTKTFTSSDDVNFYADAKYYGDSNVDCLFIRKATGEVYWLEVHVSLGDQGSGLLKVRHQYIVTCTLDNQGSRESKLLNLVDGLIPRQELQHHLGEISHSTFTLDITDANGNTLNDVSIPIGEKIRLKATISGNPSEVGLRVSSCCAMDGSAVYPIILGGCGNGVIIPTNMGFETRGNQSKSPIFEAFQLATGSDVQFACNFTSCLSNCDGDNCLSERRKRNAEHGFETYVEVQSGFIEVREQTTVRILFNKPDMTPSVLKKSKPSTTSSDLKEAESAFLRFIQNKHTLFQKILWGTIVSIIIFVVFVCTICMLFAIYVIGSTSKVISKIKEILKTRRVKLGR